MRPVFSCGIHNDGLGVPRGVWVRRAVCACALRRDYNANQIRPPSCRARLYGLGTTSQDLVHAHHIRGRPFSTGEREAR